MLETLASSLVDKMGNVSVKKEKAKQGLYAKMKVAFENKVDQTMNAIEDK